MLHLNKVRLNEHGISLVELLAVIILISFISIFTMSLIVQSNETTREIHIESQFRDEADVIVSKLTKKMYETNRAHIVQVVSNAEGNYLNITSDLTKCKKDDDGNWIIDSACKNSFQKVGFVNDGGVTKLYLEDKIPLADGSYITTDKHEIYEVNNKDIELLNNSTIYEDVHSNGAYEIDLHLKYKSKRGGKEIEQKMQFKNRIQPY